MTAFAVDNPTSLYRASVADIGDVSDSDLIEMMVAARRAASRMQAVELAAVAELARRREAEDEVPGVGVVSAWDYLHDEVASALTLTATSADGLIRFATELTRRLPVTFAALAAGELDYAKARTVWQAAAQVDDEIAAEIEARLLPRAMEQTTGQVRAKVRRLVERLDPDALTRRREHAERGRDVQLVPTDDGTAHLSGLDLPADAATAAHNRLHAIAAGLKTDGDRRGIGQLRADVFLALLSGTLTTTEPPADPSRHQITPAPARPEDDWTGIDDVIADAIAHTARAHLTMLSGELHGSATRNPGPDEVLAHTVGDAPTASSRGRAGAAISPPSRSDGRRTPNGPARPVTEVRLPPGVPDRGVLERREGAAVAVQRVRGQAFDQAVAEIIAQAGARITDALTALKTPWCVQNPTARLWQRDQNELGGLTTWTNNDPTANDRSSVPSDRHTESRDGQQGSEGQRGPAPRQDADARYDSGGQPDFCAQRDSDGHEPGGQSGVCGHRDSGRHEPGGHRDSGRHEPGGQRDSESKQDPQSQQGRHGNGGYRVPARMRRLIEDRDRRCGFPGCRRPVRHCDADHTIPYHRGGPTCPCNLAMLCRYHHALKQTRRWRLHQLWPGVLLWITPTGHWRITAPPDRE